MRGAAQVLDDGRVTDSQGRTVSFRNVILILTSNIGASYILDPDADAGAARERVLAAVRGNFRPEFVNRLDEFIVFEPLRQAQIERIVSLQAARVAQRLAAKKMGLQLTPGALRYLSAVGYGAPPAPRSLCEQHRGAKQLTARPRGARQIRCLARAR